MEKQQATCWVRTRVPPKVKEWCQETANWLGWNIPGVESAAITFLSTLFTPQEFATHISDALRVPEPQLEMEGANSEEEE